MNKRLLFITLLFISITSHGQESIAFKTKFSPNKKYKTEIMSVSQTELDFVADDETIERIRKKGIQLPIITKSETNMSTDIITYGLKKNGEFPAKMVYGKMTTTTTQNGEIKTEEKPYSGMIIMGKYNVENKFKVDSIIGSQVSEEMKKSLIEILESVQQQVNFPKKAMKVGDTFKKEIPMTIPLENMNPIRIKIYVEYLLKQINGNIATFDLKQTIGLDMVQEQFNVTANGSGSGISEYNIKEHYLTKYTSELPMDVTVKVNEKVTLKMKMAITSEQNVVIE